MLTDDGKHLYVSWDEYHQLIERLALKIHASGWEFDQILCLARGGMRPGDVLSRIFDKPLGIMFWATIIFMPIIVAYTSWAYSVMAGKVTAAYIRENEHSAY